MSDRHPSDLDERRVMRLLAAAAADVAPLAPEAVERVVRGATRGARRRPSSPGLHHAVAAAAVAAVALGSTLGLTASQPQRDPAGAASADVVLESFPEGSALHLLLAPRAEERSS